MSVLNGRFVSSHRALHSRIQLDHYAVRVENDYREKSLYYILADRREFVIVNSLTETPQANIEASLSSLCSAIDKIASRTGVEVSQLRLKEDT